MIDLVDSLEKIKSSPKYIVGDMIQDLETSKVYVKTLLGWDEVSIEQEINAGNLYDLNKTAIAQFPPMKDKEVSKMSLDIDNFCSKKENTFYMLLNNDLHYFTLLQHMPRDADFAYPGNAITSLFLELNYNFLTYDRYDDRIEIWVKDNSNNEVYMYILFPYDAGVVTFKYV